MHWETIQKTELEDAGRFWPESTWSAELNRQCDVANIMAVSRAGKCILIEDHCSASGVKNLQRRSSLFLNFRLWSLFENFELMLRDSSSRREWHLNFSIVSMIERLPTSSLDDQGSANLVARRWNTRQRNWWNNKICRWLLEKARLDSKLWSELLASSDELVTEKTEKRDNRKQSIRWTPSSFCFEIQEPSFRTKKLNKHHRGAKIGCQSRASESLLTALEVSDKSTKWKILHKNSFS